MSNHHQPVYVLDSDVLMQANRMYYAFDICSGFWDSLVLHQSRSMVKSIDKVLDEINGGQGMDALKRWARDIIPPDFFCSTNDADVLLRYGEIVNWVDRQDFTQSAKSEFASVADGWLVACGKAKNQIVVTLETSEPERKNKVKIPDVCHAFDVQCKDTFYMLRALGVNLKL